MKNRKFNKIMKFACLSLIIMLVFSNISSAQEYSLTYDKNGNLVKDADKTYEYNSENQLVKIKDTNGTTLAEYYYDYLGDRIKKIEYKSGKSTTTYYPNENFVRVKNSSGTYDIEYYYANNQLVGKYEKGKKYLYHPDNLGSTNIITNESGSIVEKTEYEPFGTVLEGGKDRYGFTGQENDAVGLMYYGARYYSPYLSRFTQPDTIIQNVYDPQSLNRYAYARNNPLKYVDPSGNFFDVVLDVGFIFYDIYSLVTKPSWENLGYLGLDVGCAFIPFVTGAGVIARIGKTLNKADDIIDAGKTISKAGKAGKTIDKASDVSKLGKAVDKASDVSKVAKKGSDLEKIKNTEKFTKILPDGRIRIYEKFKDATKPGIAVGARGVKEINPISKITERFWYETYDKLGRVIQVHPKYPKDLGHFIVDSITKKIIKW